MTIRLAAEHERADLARVAERDSRLPPAPRLVAERDGTVLAILSLETGEVVADPFRPTADLVELLRCRTASESLDRPAGEPAAATDTADRASHPDWARRRGSASMNGEPTVRRELRAGDLGAIIAHHGRLYPSERGVDASFEAHVAASVAAAGRPGWPRETEAVWIVELTTEHAGSLALTDEGGGLAMLRWFVLDPQLRGRGLGRRLIAELLELAEWIGYERIALETFSELSAAAHLYRLRVRGGPRRDGPRWGRSEITYQRYELTFQRRAQSLTESAGPRPAPSRSARRRPSRGSHRGPSARRGLPPRARADAARAGGRRGRARSRSARRSSGGARPGPRGWLRPSGGRSARSPRENRDRPRGARSLAWCSAREAVHPRPPPSLGDYRSAPLAQHRPQESEFVQVAHGPVSVGARLPPSASATTSFGTPRPLLRPLPVAAANTVVRTSPSVPTTGPPELPLRTAARTGVIRRSIGPRHTNPRHRPCARRAGVNVSGPFSG